MWHEARSFGVPANRPLIWHCWHDTLTWNPVSGNLVSELWSNFAPPQAVVLRQVAQVGGKPAGWWFGFGGMVELGRRQDAGGVRITTKKPLICHCWDGTLTA